ncbi:hypothetical protein P3T76_013347 [Phytophthora citrophthora]|uniref:Uncharacterized protein n=1 Tax=Phytophthora citrophthora TaxID=4793 RepID=A0AAD9G3C6_9STRA|nr:hypothetical protein P3T76_013347 [Phytophthora citrophthora]
MYAELDRISSGFTATGSFTVHTDNGDEVRMAPSSLSELSSDSDASNDEDDAGESKTETDNGEEPAPSRRLRRQRREVNPRALTLAKRRQTTGEKMSDAMTTMANVQHSIATVILECHNRGRQLTCSDEAIQIFKEMFTDKVPVEQRFKFVELLASEPEAATMFSNMDDEAGNTW